jgi:hypothetical protein
MPVLSVWVWNLVLVITSKKGNRLKECNHRYLLFCRNRRPTAWAKHNSRNILVEIVLHTFHQQDKDADGRKILNRVS